MVKHLPAMRETWVRSLGWDPLEKEIEPTPVPLLGKSHGWRSLVGYSPWGRKKLDTTERLLFFYKTQKIIIYNLQEAFFTFLFFLQQSSKELIFSNLSINLFICFWLHHAEWQDLSSPTRDQTHTSAVKVQSPQPLDHQRSPTKHF